MSKTVGLQIPELAAFDHQPRTRLVFGAGSVDRVAELASGLGGKRVLVVTDPGIVKAGHAERVLTKLREAGLHAALYDRVRENPTTADVARCLETARAEETDLFIGLGGGSSMDTAKGCNFILTNGGEMKDYRGVGKATRSMLPLIAIPTTAGTGSECQSAALIADEATHVKMACLDPKAAARVAILDPRLTVSQPPGVTAVTGIDAIAHALETAVTTKRNPISRMYSMAASQCLFPAFPEVLRDPGNLAARSAMLLGAAYAGLAIESSMLGAAHASANPLTARHNVVHGRAVGVMMPWVIRFNAGVAEAAQIYTELAAALRLVEAGTVGVQSAESLAVKVEELLDLAGLTRRLGECGVRESDIPAMAADAAQQWTGGFNPRKVTEPDFEALYRQAFFGRS